jgi:hypothetical protein
MMMMMTMKNNQVFNIEIEMRKKIKDSRQRYI